MNVLGGAFLYVSIKMSYITQVQVFQTMPQMFQTTLSEQTDLSDETINEWMNIIMNGITIPVKKHIYLINIYSFRTNLQQ